MIRERIIRFNYEDSALEFIVDKDVRSFQQVLGKMLSYGLRAETKAEGVELVELYLDAEGTLTGAFYPALNYDAAGIKENQTPFLALSASLEEFKDEDPTTLVARQNTDGAYSFH